MPTYTYSSITADLQAGLSWADLAKKHQVSWQKLRGFYTREQLRAAGASTPTPTSSAPSAPSTPEPVDAADPFADVPRDVVEAAASASEEAADDDADGSASRAPLGREAAQAYLPMLYATMDGAAGAMAVWVLSRKLGPLATQELREQAKQLACLTEPEKTALESALVSKLAAVELNENEALLLTLAGIYAGKAMMVMQLEAPSVLTVTPRADA